MLTASDEAATETMLSVATGTTDVPELAQWLRTVVLRF
jgi:prophage maintenance system killer protein